MAGISAGTFLNRDFLTNSALFLKARAQHMRAKKNSL
jgi:hypothetical protein